ncbi:MAG: hypothetical protein E6Q32_03180 [Neisseriales bacterium]|nr:MAG: hypothetical protein E6Q32_03180 [Neisseriales bacterium]
MNSQNKILLLILLNISVMFSINSCSIKPEAVSPIIKQQESDLVIGFVSAATQKAPKNAVESS